MGSLDERGLNSILKSYLRLNFRNRVGIRETQSEERKRERNESKRHTDFSGKIEFPL